MKIMRAIVKNVTAYPETYLSLVVLEMLIWNIVTGDPIDITNAFLIMGFTLLALKKGGLPFKIGKFKKYSLNKES
jgi:hypothetical protein